MKPTSPTTQQKEGVMATIPEKNERLLETYLKLGFSKDQAKHVTAAVLKAELTDGQQAALSWYVDKFISENSAKSKYVAKDKHNAVEIANNLVVSLLKEQEGGAPIQEKLDLLERQYKTHLKDSGIINMEAGGRSRI